MHTSSTANSPSTGYSLNTAQRLLRHAARWCLGLLGLTVALVTVLMALVAVLDWNRIKPWVNDKVSEATGRRFAIEGDLAVAWQWPQPLEENWYRWIPSIAVSAERLVLDNPTDFTPPFTEIRSQDNPELQSNADRSTNAAAAPSRMANIDSAVGTVRLLPLLSKVVWIDTIELTGPHVNLARKTDGVNNWTFENKNGSQSGWTVDLDRLLLRRGVLGYADGVNDLELSARVDTTDSTHRKDSGSSMRATPVDAKAIAAKTSTVDASARGAQSIDDPLYGLRFELNGRYGKAKVKGSGRAGQIISLREKKVNYPVQIDIDAGSVALAAEGFLTNPGALSGLDFQVFLKGASMSDLFGLTGLVLPSTPPFETKGRLTGSLEPKHAVWKYNDFDGKVGQSDLHGSLTYTSGQPRPRLAGTVSSNLLHLADIGPTLGTNNPANSHRGRDGKGQRGKVLPNSTFEVQRWNAMDMDISFNGRSIVRPESLPLEDVSLRAVMDNAQLTLAPITLSVAQGKIESEVRIDGRAPPLKAKISAKIRGLQLSALFPKVQLMKKSFGQMDGAIALETRGDSIAGLLGQGTGEVRLYVRNGTLSKQMLDLAALNVGSIIVGKLFGDDKEVRLRCAVADFMVVEGVARTRTVKMSTDDAVVQATGTVDLGNEELNLRITPESLEWKFFSLRSPLYIRGTLGSPDIGVEVGPLLLRAGAAVAAAVVAPAALALLPITVPAADDDTDCKPLLNLAQKPVRPGNTR